MNLRSIPKPIRLRLAERAKQWPGDLTAKIIKMQRQYDDLIAARTERNQSITEEKRLRSWLSHYTHTALVDQYAVGIVRAEIDRAERQLNKKILMQRAYDGLPEELVGLLETTLRAHANFTLYEKEQKDDAQTTEEYAHCEMIFQASFIAFTDALAELLSDGEIGFDKLRQAANVDILLYDIEDAYAERQKIAELFEESEGDLEEID